IVLSFYSPGTLLPSPHSDEQLAALRDSAVLSLGPGVLRSLLQLPSAVAEIVDALLEALRERQESLAQFGNVVHAERLRGKLLQLARTHGAVVSGGVRLELPLTHELLLRRSAPRAKPSPRRSEPLSERVSSSAKEGS